MIPLFYIGDGRFQATTPYHRQRVDKLYGRGQEIIVEEVGEAHSQASRGHYFARLHELWLNMPEWLEDEFASETHLRKWALCKTGYCTVKKVVFPTNKEAADWAATIQQMDDYVIVEVVGRVLTVRIAESQAIRAMGNDRFQKSKTDVLTYVEKLVASPPPKEASNDQ